LKVLLTAYFKYASPENRKVSRIFVVREPS